MTSPFPLSPTPPDFAHDWDRLQVAYPPLTALAGCAQDPIHHPEGDVLVHTRQVCACLVADPRWRAMDEPERGSLFFAALAHDWAKPACSVADADGRIHTPGHATHGASMIRKFIMENEELSRVSLALRETVVSMVALHSLPLWALERDDPKRAVLAASLSVRCDHLALLAEADVRGRDSADQQDLLDRVELFRQYAHELRCLDRPFPFPSDHTKLRYFRAPHRIPPEVELFDDTWGEVVVMSGLPGAGKDHCIRRHLSHLPVVSLDELRAELSVSPAGDQGVVVQAARERCRRHLRARRPFVVNATHTTRMTRGPLMDLCLTYGARVRIVYIERPLPLILAQNAARPDPAPEAVIRRLLARLDPPRPTEAHAVERRYVP